MEFASLLRRLRSAAGLTQLELADRSGIARPNIASYEAGRREPKWSTAERLLAAVGRPLIVDESPEWRWTATRRPYAVASKLWRLEPARRSDGLSSRRICGGAADPRPSISRFGRIDSERTRSSCGRGRPTTSSASSTACCSVRPGPTWCCPPQLGLSGNEPSTTFLVTRRRSHRDHARSESTLGRAPALLAAFGGGLALAGGAPLFPVGETNGIPVLASQDAAPASLYSPSGGYAS